MFPANLPRPLRLGLYGLVTGVVLYICLAPSADVPGSNLIWDKAAHSLTWAILTGVGLVLAPQRPRAIPLFTLALGAAIEMAQAAMPYGRQGDWRDFLADSLGVALVMLVAVTFQPLLRATREPDDGLSSRPGRK
jgi:VanZ family protein